MKLEHEMCDLGEVFRAAWAQLAAQRLNRDVRLVVETNGVNLKCRADFFRLEQVFRNLLENSLAACSDPVELQLHCSQMQLSGQTVLRLALRDNGPGLSPEAREKLFEPFHTTKSKGTGLGMSIARRIVESHGGRIVAGNSGTAGAEFIVTLPSQLVEAD